MKPTSIKNCGWKRKSIANDTSGRKEEEVIKIEAIAVEQYESSSAAAAAAAMPTDVESIGTVPPTSNEQPMTRLTQNITAILKTWKDIDISEIKKFMPGWQLWQLIYRKQAELENKKAGETFSLLIKYLVTSSVPYFKASDSIEEVLHCLKEHFQDLDIDESEITFAVQVFQRTLSYVEPKFHPLIREGHTDDLLAILGIKQKAQFDDLNLELQPEYFDDEYSHVIEHTIAEKLKACECYRYAESQVSLCEECAEYPFETDDIKDDTTAQTKFSRLRPELIEMCMKDRQLYLRLVGESRVYFDCMKNLVADLEKGSETHSQRRILSEIMKLRNQGFFTDKGDDDAWKECLKDESVHEFIRDMNESVFKTLPKSYVVQGLMDYLEVHELISKNTKSQWPLLAEVVCRPHDLKCCFFYQLWKEMRRCVGSDHHCYRVFRQPLSTLKWKESEMVFECLESGFSHSDGPEPISEPITAPEPQLPAAEPHAPRQPPAARQPPAPALRQPSAVPEPPGRAGSISQVF